MGGPRVHVWDEESIELLKKWWAAGWSGSEIARRFGGYTTKNAVIGKANRLGLLQKQSGKARPIAPAPKPKNASKPGVHLSWHRQVSAVELPGDFARLKGEAWKADPNVKPVTLMDLEAGMCRWPLGDDKPFLFCGQHATAGSYCEHHHKWSIGLGSSYERAAIKEAVSINRADWRESEKAREKYNYQSRMLASVD